MRELLSVVNSMGFGKCYFCDEDKIWKEEPFYVKRTTEEYLICNDCMDFLKRRKANLKQLKKSHELEQELVILLINKLKQELKEQPKKEFEKLVGKLKELKDIPFADWYEHGILNTKEIKNARQLINVSLDFLIKESEELQSSILKQVEKLEKETNYKECDSCNSKQVIVYRDKYGKFFCKECMKTIIPSSEGKILGVWDGLINYIEQLKEQPKFSKERRLKK